MCDQRSVRIVWPEMCYVPETQLRLWFSDAVDNGVAEADEGDSLENICRELNYVGVITLHRDWKEGL